MQHEELNYMKDSRTVVNNEPVEMLVKYKLMRPRRVGAFVFQDKEGLDEPFLQEYKAGSDFNAYFNPEEQVVRVSTLDNTAFAEFEPAHFCSMFDFKYPTNERIKAINECW